MKSRRNRQVFDDVQADRHFVVEEIALERAARTGNRLVKFHREAENAGTSRVSISLPLT